ncbi:MAG TPA: hypothetical protein VK187_13425 [Geobacteraceae bacterium]|nr:hypothetical protein [Geobacteraceae bacterium]
MFGWFRKKADEPLVFPDNQAAYDYACQHLDNRILFEAVIPALVLEQGSRGSEGERYFLVQLAGRDGGRQLWACTLKEATSFPAPGDLIGFRVVRYDPDLAEGLDLLGYIAFGFEPVFVPRKGWRIDKNYTPDNIRQTVRW